MREQKNLNANTSGKFSSTVTSAKAQPSASHNVVESFWGGMTRSFNLSMLGGGPGASMGLGFGRLGASGQQGDRAMTAAGDRIREMFEDDLDEENPKDDNLTLSPAKIKEITVSRIGTDESSDLNQAE